MDPVEGVHRQALPRRRRSACAAAATRIPTRMRSYNLPTDQYAKYWTSVHGQRLAAAVDTRVAICIDCHGSHDIKKASDPTAAVFPHQRPEAVRELPRRRRPGWSRTGSRPTSSRSTQKSVHGQALLVKGDTRAPSCASCHGSHDAKPPTAARGRRGLRQVPHRDPGAVQAEPALGAGDGGAEMLDLPRHPRRVAARLRRCSSTPTPPEYVCVTCHDLDTRQLRLELDALRERGRSALRHLPSPGFGHLRPDQGDRRLAVRRRGRLRRTPRRGSTRPPAWA